MFISVLHLFNTLFAVLLTSLVTLLPVYAIVFFSWKQLYEIRSEIHNITNLVIQTPPTALQSIEYLIYFLAFLLSIRLIAFTFKTRNRTIRKINKNAKLTNPDAEIKLLFKNLCKQAKVKAKLLITDNPNTLAYAIQLPLSNTVVLNNNFLNQLGHTSNVEWVLGHELAHIKHNDSIISSFQIHASQIQTTISDLKYNFVMGIVRILRLIRIPSLIIKAILLPFNFVFWLTRMANGLVITISTIIDKHLQRKMEYRADLFASGLVSAEVGINILKALGETQIENQAYAGLFDTHPTNSQRIEHLKLMKSIG